MAGPEGAQGQAAPNPSPGTTGAAPQSQTAGQPANHAQTTNSGPSGGEVESFFDPKSLDGKPELQAAYKQMQAKWTKDNQRFKEGRSKVDAYDSFISSPLESMQRLAKQLGYNVVQQAPNGGGETEDDTPKTWADVYAKAEESVMKKLRPLVGEIQQMKQTTVESYMDQHHSDWRQYEDEMRGVLQKHPSMANDLDTLYRMVVPEEVHMARATQAAIAKLKSTGEAGQISGTSTAAKNTTKEELPRGGSFSDFVAIAKARLAKQGIRQ